MHTTKHRAVKNGSKSAFGAQSEIPPRTAGQPSKARYVKFYLMSDESKEYQGGHELVIDTTLAPKLGDVAVVRLHSFKERSMRGDEMTTAQGVGHQLMRVLSTSRKGYRLINVKPGSRPASFTLAQVRDIHPVIDYRDPRDSIEKFEPIPEDELAAAASVLARNVRRLGRKANRVPLNWVLHLELGSTTTGLFRLVRRAKPYPGPLIMW